MTMGERSMGEVSSLMMFLAIGLRLNSSCVSKVGFSKVWVSMSSLCLIINSNKKTRIVIPAQAGIQTLAIQKCLEIAVILNFWIPACAGMTA